MRYFVSYAYSGKAGELAPSGFGRAEVQFPTIRSIRDIARLEQRLSNTNGLTGLTVLHYQPMDGPLDSSPRARPEPARMV